MKSVFWPSRWLIVREAGRSTYNDSKTAVLARFGNFTSSDRFGFQAADHGVELQRRFSLDVDGNLRLYSLDKLSNTWKVSWQLFVAACRVHGVCGLNSLCSYDPISGRKCSCISGYRMRNPKDWSYGCEPDIEISCNNTSSLDFLPLRHVEFYGHDIAYYRNKTLQECKDLCLKRCDCKGFEYKFIQNHGTYSCYPKTLLFNGYVQSSWPDFVYLKVPKSGHAWQEAQYEGNLLCDDKKVMLDRAYRRKEHDGWIKSFICEEIGRGGGGIVYKGKLSDDRIAAIKSLNCSNYQGEAEFLAEVSTIGNLNHMNLIELWGYCAERKHRLLVYDYMEYGSLSDNLNANNLDCEKSYGIGLLEMITGKSPEVCAHGGYGDDDSMGLGLLVTWIREKMRETSERKSWIQEIVDPALDGKFDLEKMEILLKLALQCSKEDRDARPTMCEVVDKMVHPENLELKIDMII
ncbi:hypothetical protein K7X08_001952 [Anisodus acutangulus]|uniref:Uncharacterized protein n=1 Tax=Anisodus acutangulus TaxID=402998 RepID=A0A9Q1LNA3_9SOLA|nr:hypothetical protein K7X08_001952 [Anisodus acutangulus]